MSKLSNQFEDVDFGLTIQDPWAQAIVWGSKRIENRTWKPPDKVIGKRIAVGASKTVDAVAKKAMHVTADRSKLRVRTQMVLNDYRSSVRNGANSAGVTCKTFDFHHHPGHVIGTVRVCGYLDDERSRHRIEHPGPYSERPYCDSHEYYPDLIVDAMRDDPWYTGPVAWLLDDPKPLDEPIPVRGMPGVWNVEKQIKTGGDQ